MQSANLYFTADQIRSFMGVSRSMSYKICRELNEELALKGYLTVPGKVPKRFLYEKLYGLEEADQQDQVAV